MDTFYSGSTNQRENVMPNDYIRDPNHIPYPESLVQGNMLYVNYSSSAPFSDSLAVSTQSQQNCEIPIATSVVSHDSSVTLPTRSFSASHFGENNCSGWRDGRNEMLLMQTIGGPTNGEDSLIHTSSLGILNGHNLSLEQSKGLSLSLGTQIPMPSFHYRPTLGNGESCRDDNLRNNDVHMNSSSYGLSNLMNSIPNSKYLKAAQQLLDEVVNVQKALKQKADKSQGLHTSGVTTGYKDTDKGLENDGVSSNAQESSANFSKELSPSERQDLQNKVTKLLAMLDEVDRRYKQYYHQMQIVVSSFDAIAGSGAAKPYTALALQTISCHFRCLRDAITARIQATRKSLGEQDGSIGKGIGISRLRYIDQELRQQRAMQQFGMMQPHAWRPQRGLPENSVSVLRAWLFEHFLHPYPKDSEKLMLARQAGLTRGQVSNWFINARVRLWKPMIEEMHKEEVGETEIDSNSSSGNPHKFREQTRSSEDKEDCHRSPPEAERCQENQFNNSKFNLISDVNTNVDDAYMNLKYREQSPNGDNCSFVQEAIGHPDGSERFMAYQMGGYGNTGVSLTLGLQHCDGGLPVSDGQQSFLSVREEHIYGTDPPSIGTEDQDFEYMNVGDQRHQFGSTHLLHDFVA